MSFMRGIFNRGSKKGKEKDEPVAKAEDNGSDSEVDDGPKFGRRDRASDDEGDGEQKPAGPPMAARDDSDDEGDTTEDSSSSKPTATKSDNLDAKPTLSDVSASSQSELNGTDKDVKPEVPASTEAPKLDENLQPPPEAKSVREISPAIDIQSDSTMVESDTTESDFDRSATCSGLMTPANTPANSSAADLNLVKQHQLEDAMLAEENACASEIASPPVTTLMAEEKAAENSSEKDVGVDDNAVNSEEVFETATAEEHAPEFSVEPKETLPTPLALNNSEVASDQKIEPPEGTTSPGNDWASVVTAAARNPPAAPPTQDPEVDHERYESPSAEMLAGEIAMLPAEGEEDTKSEAKEDVVSSSLPTDACPVVSPKETDVDAATAEPKAKHKEAASGEEADEEESGWTDDDEGAEAGEVGKGEAEAEEDDGWGDAPEKVVEGERESGDGEENAVPAADRPIDLDEDAKNPAYVPRLGRFYEHDSRVKNSPESDAKLAPSRSDKAEKWGHDKFYAEEQGPKQARFSRPARGGGYEGGRPRGGGRISAYSANVQPRGGYGGQQRYQGGGSQQQQLPEKRSGGFGRGPPPHHQQQRDDKADFPPLPGDRRGDFNKPQPKSSWGPSRRRSSEGDYEALPPSQAQAQRVGGAPKSGAGPRPSQADRQSSPAKAFVPRGGLRQSGPSREEPPRLGGLGRGKPRGPSSKQSSDEVYESARGQIGRAAGGVEDIGWGESAAAGGEGDDDAGWDAPLSTEQEQGAAAPPAVREAETTPRTLQSGRVVGGPVGKSYSSSRGQQSHQPPPQPKQPTTLQARAGGWGSSNQKPSRQQDAAGWEVPVGSPAAKGRQQQQANEQWDEDQQHDEVFAPDTSNRRRGGFGARGGSGAPRGGGRGGDYGGEGGRGGDRYQQQQGYDQREGGRQYDNSARSDGRRAGGGGGRYGNEPQEDYHNRPFPSMEFRRRGPPAAPQGSSSGGGRRGGGDDYYEQDDHRQDDRYHGNRQDDGYHGNRQQPSSGRGGGGGRQQQQMFAAAPAPTRHVIEKQQQQQAPQAKVGGAAPTSRKQDLPPRFQQTPNRGPGDQQQYRQETSRDQGGYEEEQGDEAEYDQRGQQQQRAHSEQPYAEGGSAAYAGYRQTPPGEGGSRDESGDRNVQPKRYSATRQQQQGHPQPIMSSQQQQQPIRIVQTGHVSAANVGSAPRLSTSSLTKDPSLVHDFTPSGQVVAVSSAGGEMHPSPHQMGMQMQGYYNGYQGADGVIYTAVPPDGNVSMIQAAPIYAQDPQYCMPPPPHMQMAYAGADGSTYVHLPPGVPMPAFPPGVPLPPMPPPEMLFQPPPEGVDMGYAGPPPPGQGGMVYYAPQQQMGRPQQQMRARQALPIVQPGDRGIDYSRQQQQQYPQQQPQQMSQQQQQQHHESYGGNRDQ